MDYPKDASNVLDTEGCGAWRGLLVVAVVSFEAIYGLESEADHTTFPAKTKFIKGH